MPGFRYLVVVTGPRAGAGAAANRVHIGPIQERRTAERRATTLEHLLAGHGCTVEVAFLDGPKMSANDVLSHLNIADARQVTA